MKRKIIKCLLLICFCLMFGGCGGNSVRSEKEIREELQNRDVFAHESINISDFQIIKRQTDEDKKEDIVYVHVKGENADFSVVRNYKILYVLYNDGWLLENIEPYIEGEYFDETIPLHGVDDELIESYFSDYENYNPNTYFSSMLWNVSHGKIEIIEKDTYYESYKQVHTYEYDLFKEDIVITVSFYLNGFSWDSLVDVACIPYLKDSTMGQWHADVVMGWSMAYGLKEGGDNAEGYIDVILEQESKLLTRCTINAWIGSLRYNLRYAGCDVQSIIPLEYMYDKEGNITGLIISKPYEDYDNMVKITGDGLIYKEDGIEWRLEKVN